MSRMDHLYVPGKEVIHFTPDKGKAWESSSYNYKLLVSINEDSEVWAEIDSDSHLNLITEEYYFYLANNTQITYINEPPTSFSGMGSQLKSEYPPIMLQVQIGNVICQARFIVTNHLKSSKILLGSDFLVKNHMSIGTINPEDHSWICTIGTPIIGKVT